MDDPSDGQHLAAWKAGETQAFEALVDRHQAALLRHARALLGERTGVEDAVQEAFLRLAQKPPEMPADALGDPEAERAVLASWLHRVMRNLCMDTLRQESRRRRREETVAPEEAVAGGLDQVEARDTRTAVERGLAKLAADQREVLVLRLFGDRSYAEIAEITGKKLGTIGWLISVGMKALATELSPLVALPAVVARQPSQGIGRSAGEVGSAKFHGGRS